MVQAKQEAAAEAAIAKAKALAEKIAKAKNEAQLA
jgi:hypothetical protein